MSKVTIAEFGAVRRIMRHWGYAPHDTALVWNEPFRDWLGKRPVDMSITRAETPEPMSPFMIFPVSTEATLGYMRAAYRGGCDPYNSVDAAESALLKDIEIEQADLAAYEAEEAHLRSAMRVDDRELSTPARKRAYAQAYEART